MIGHGLADVVGRGRDKDRIREELAGLAQVHVPHVGSEDQDDDLDEKSDAREQQECPGCELLEDQTDHGHDGKLQYRLKKIRIAKFFFRATEISDDLDHEVVDHVVRKEETDHAHKKEGEGRICLDECGKRTASGSFCRVAGGGILTRGNSLPGGFLKSEDQYRGECHDGDVDIKKDPDAVVLDETADKGGGHGETGGPKPPGQAVHDGASGFLVFEAQCGHDRLVGELDHVDQGENREDQDLVVFRKKKNDRSRKDHEDGDQDKPSVGQRPLLVDDAGNYRLGDRGQDIGEGQEYTNLGVGKTIAEKEDGGARMDRTECGEVRRIDERIADRPEDTGGSGRRFVGRHVRGLLVFLR